MTAAWIDDPCDVDAHPVERPTVFLRPGVPDRQVERFALEADVTVYWPWVRPCYDRGAA